MLEKLNSWRESSCWQFCVLFSLGDRWKKTKKNKKKIKKRSSIWWKNGWRAFEGLRKKKKKKIVVSLRASRNWILKKIAIENLGGRNWRRNAEVLFAQEFLGSGCCRRRRRRFARIGYKREKTTEKCTGIVFRLSVLNKICKNWV